MFHSYSAVYIFLYQLVRAYSSSLSVFYRIPWNKKNLNEDQNHQEGGQMNNK